MEKEEILRKIVPNNCYWEDNFDNVPRHYIETAMDKYSEIQSCLFAEWIAKNYHHSISLKGEHFWEDKSLPRRAGNPIESTVEIYKKFKP